MLRPVRSRTLLTTPPGRRPDPVTTPAVVPAREHYSPALDLPVEPLPPSRLARPVLVLAVVVVLVATGILATRLLAPPAQDPSVPGGSPAAGA